MENCKIIKCQFSHLEILVSLSQTTFRQTYENLNQADNFANYMNEAFKPSKLRAELEHPASRFFLVQQGQEYIGYLKTNLAPMQTDVNDPLSLEIERIYILKTYHGKNIGKLLVDKAIEEAKKGQLQYIWLGVWKKNPRAIHFYKKHGFRKFGTHIFQIGEDLQEDFLMKLIISEC